MRSPPAYSPASFYRLATYGTLGPLVALVFYVFITNIQSAFFPMERHLAEIIGDLLALFFCGIIASIHLLLLHRMWRQIETPATPRHRTPLAITLLLLVPVWNLYWCFVAYAGLASALNHHVRARALIAPRNPAALASAAYALACIVTVSGLIAYVIEHNQRVGSIAEQFLLPLCFIIALFCSFPALILFLISWWAMVIQSAAIARNIRHPSADQPPADAPPTTPGQIVAPLPRN